MPVSVYHHVPAVLEEVQRISPQAVLDLGIGFGKWGVLVREVLDAWYGRLKRDQWLVRIAGVEVFEPYRNPVWQVYDYIRIEDFGDTSNWHRYRDYGLVMLMDSLEHLEPELGRRLLDHLVKYNGAIVISVPNGKMPQDEPVFGNANERHLWTFNGLEEFARFPNVKLLHQSVCTVVSITK